MQSITGILFVAATCIGSGMIALPVMLAKIGLIPSIVLMIITWLVIYHTSLINVELNLQAKKGLALGALCKKFSGKKTQIVGTVSLKVLFYALLAAYISLGSSVIRSLAPFLTNVELLYSCALILILCMPAHIVKHLNNALFLILFSIIGLLILWLAISCDWSNLPLINQQAFHEISVWSITLPVLFTAFGFQVIFHTLTDYYSGNAKILRKVFFWGSLIPAIVYILWNVSILSAIHNFSPEFYEKMSHEAIQVNELITQLSLIAKNESVQYMIMWLSLLAIVTSAIGVGLGLVGSIHHAIKSHIKCYNHFIACIFTVLPGYVIVKFIPNAFVSILGFAGTILSLIAILLPIYLLRNVRSERLFYKILSNQFLVILSGIFGILIIACGVYNMI